MDVGFLAIFLFKARTTPLSRYFETLRQTLTVLLFCIRLRYCLQKAWSPLPKSDNPGRIKQNADIYGFELDKEDMQKLDSQDQGGKGALVVAVSND